ncbi:DHHC palmitoyltransferase-domain-containing protein [Phycomyces nitens]|nr:DHHC palmitoyltransferase-domain-containing protein [Phycomyces nitens]
MASSQKRPPQEQSQPPSLVVSSIPATSTPSTESRFRLLNSIAPPAGWDEARLGLHSTSQPLSPFFQSNSILRFTDNQVPDSLENLGLPSKQRLIRSSNASATDESSLKTIIDSSHNEDSIPHCSGVTSLSNMTNDDSTTLIGQVRQPIMDNYKPSPAHVPPLPTPLLSSPAPLNPTISSTSIQAQPPVQTLSVPQLQRRNYQDFPGRNKFFCGGRFMTSREYWAFLVALVLIIGPSVLFGIFTCPFLWDNVHPAVPIVFCYLFVLSFASMIKTSWTDPGIIPRDLDPTPEFFDDQGSAYYGESDWSHVPVQKEVKIRDNTWALRYCDTCKLYRPPRASHCRQCDNCVENEDHHCIWLNNCIGKRNYRPFFTFIVTATLLCLLVIVFSIVHLLLIVREHSGDVTFDVVFHAAPVSFVLAIVCFLLLWMVGGLTFYHCSLIFKGVTTHEQLRASIINSKYPGISANPFNKGSPGQNMIHVLCRPQPKSYLRRRKFVEPSQARVEPSQNR